MSLTVTASVGVVDTALCEMTDGAVCTDAQVASFSDRLNALKKRSVNRTSFVATGVKYCSLCQQTLSRSDFSPKCAYCKVCRAESIRARRAARKGHTPYMTEQIRRMPKHLQGLPFVSYETIAERHGEFCGICSAPPKGRRLHIDHSHKSGAVRGLLCGRCNMVLGRLEDDPALFDKAAAYLRRPSVKP